MQKADQYRMHSFRKHILTTGGRKELFELPFIQQIIIDIIENGDPILKSMGKSTLYYKDANEDGKYDICGRMNGPDVNLVYVMSFCNNQENDYYLLLQRYERMYKTRMNFSYPIGISHTDYYLDYDGNVTKKIDYPILSDTNHQDGLLSVMKEKQFIKEIK